MALSPSLVANVGRGYLYALARGMTATAARAYAIAAYGSGVSRQAATYIFGQAAVAEQIGQSIGALGQHDPLSSAAQGTRVPSEYVGVNARMYVEFASGRSKTLTIYVRARWTDTPQDIQDLALESLRRIIREGSDPVSAEITGYGPTLWDVPSTYLRFE